MAKNKAEPFLRSKNVPYLRRTFLECGSDEEKKIRLVTQLGEEAIAVLRPVKAKVPRPFADLELEWDLTDTADAYLFRSQALVAGGLSESQQSAADLLFFWTQARDANAVSDPLWEKILDAYVGLDGDKIVLGVTYSIQQKSFREKQQKEDEKKHEQWRKWQADEKASNLQFARLTSKQDQAKRLKKKYSIPDKAGTIARWLEPLSINKKK